MAVEWGDRGESVKRVERALKRHGFSVEVDGHYSLPDREAVKKFLEHVGLDDDGRVVDPDTVGILESPTLDAARQEARRVALSRRLAAAFVRLEKARDRSDFSHVVGEFTDLLSQLKALHGEIAQLEAAGHGNTPDLALTVASLEEHWLQGDAVQELEGMLSGVAPDIAAQQRSLDDLVGQLTAGSPDEAAVQLIESRLRTLEINLGEAEELVRMTFADLAAGVDKVRAELDAGRAGLEGLLASSIALQPGEKLISYLPAKRIAGSTDESDRTGAVCLTTTRLIFEDIEKRGILFFAKTSRSVTLAVDREKIAQASAEASGRGERLVLMIEGHPRPEAFEFKDGSNAAVVRDLLSTNT